jgi:hypothetical protein
LPRLGKIHLGEKKKNAQGVEYPTAVDYFVCPPEVSEIFGDKPKSLRIMFPTDDTEQFASQFYRAYSSTRGLICKGNGETAEMLVDSKTKKIADHTAQTTELIECECLGRDCPYYDKKCKEIMMLQFLIPEAPGLGVYQLDTSSINSIININSAVNLIQRALGRIAMVPLTLTLEPLEVQHDGKKKTVHVINLKTGVRLSDLAQKRLSSPVVGELPEPDDEVPDLLIPENQEPKMQEAKVQPEANLPKNADADGFMLWAKNKYELGDTKIFNMLEVKNQYEIKNLSKAAKDLDALMKE